MSFAGSIAVESSARSRNPEIADILDLAAERRGIDFRDYRSHALRRGIGSRLIATGCTDPAAYCRYIDRHPDELARLVEALVVPVTAFFRDSAVFRALAEQALPALIGLLSGDRPLRAWCIGVSTGEEAWSIAMLLGAACASAGLPFDVLATDIDENALAIADRGRYASQALAAVPEKLRLRYFLPDGDSQCVNDELRSHVRFAMHDVMGRRLAPPEAIVASFNLVMIRNVLIYFDRRLQDKAFDRLASAVEPGGLLVLGPVETLPSQTSHFFRPLPGIDPKLRIFQRTELVA
jgi:chemotaxis methyl-accepting protein methylase